MHTHVRAWASEGSRGAWPGPCLSSSCCISWGEKRLGGRAGPPQPPPIPGLACFPSQPSCTPTPRPARPVRLAALRARGPRSLTPAGRSCCSCISAGPPGTSPGRLRPGGSGGRVRRAWRVQGRSERGRNILHKRSGSWPRREQARRSLTESGSEPKQMARSGRWTQLLRLRIIFGPWRKPRGFQ